MDYTVYPPYKDDPRPPFSETQKRILELKRERGALILAHNYVGPQIQDVADFVGDSLGLSRAAKSAKAELIAFAGVDFMAETAKILNPDARVVLPDASAGCSLEELCPAAKLAAAKKKYPDAVVVSYINCGVGVKELSDIICTSGNALDIVRQIPSGREIIFCPDMNLGSWVEEESGRKLILLDGFCREHVSYDADELRAAKEAFGGAPLICHPECPKPVRDVCDCVCSTEKMISYCRQAPSDKFIIATVAEMIHRLRKELPDKIFIAAPAAGAPARHCRDMLKNTPEKLLDCLENLSPEIDLPPETMDRARRPIERMLQMSK